jgi:group II intron reverse transcriptase/maturase
LEQTLRALLEAYYEPQFSDASHGFRPDRGCHTALRAIKKKWLGTVWFIEGDIKGCFDNIDHEVLLSILGEKVHDGRIINLIRGLLKAGYMEDWKRHETLGGTPQGGIISPLLANIYLDKLDQFVEGELIPTYSKGEVRRANKEYQKLQNRAYNNRRNGQIEEARTLKKQSQSLASKDPFDPNYRRLKYVRYADDFLLGFIGPRNEAETIRQRIKDFLADQLKLELSQEKTLITHARSDRAKFLGHEITVMQADNRLTGKRKARNVNGKIALIMPRSPVMKIQQAYRRKGKPIHSTILLDDSAYTIIMRYQSALKGIYNFYCMASNVAKRMTGIRYDLEQSMTKTLAHKFKVSVKEIYRRYATTINGIAAIQLTIPREGKPPLVATFGGFSMKRLPEGTKLNWTDVNLKNAWYSYGGERSEAVERLTRGECEVCGSRDNVQMHHIRSLATLKKPGRRPPTPAEELMAARRRKSIPLCLECHNRVHAGHHDGPSIR